MRTMTVSPRWSRVMHRILVPLVGAVLLVGCAGDAGGDAAGDEAADAPSGAATDTPDSPDVGTTVEGPGVVDGADPLGVLLAVVVLTTGEVDAAVAEGLVTPAELDTARDAIAAREVSAWLARADLLIGDD